MKSSNQNSNVKMPFTRRPQLILFILTACCVISMGYYYIKKENIGINSFPVKKMSPHICSITVIHRIMDKFLLQKILAVPCLQE